MVGFNVTEAGYSKEDPYWAGRPFRSDVWFTGFTKMQLGIMLAVLGAGISSRPGPGLRI